MKKFAVTTLAGVLALGLAACETAPETEAGQEAEAAADMMEEQADIAEDQGNVVAEEQLETGADMMEEKADSAGDAMGTMTDGTTEALPPAATPAP